jgi:hypothetical protein
VRLARSTLRLIMAIAARDLSSVNHTKPVATLAEGHKTHIDDLTLVCANCHRVIHRSKPWLSIAEPKGVDGRGISQKDMNTPGVRLPVQRPKTALAQSALLGASAFSCGYGLHERAWAGRIRPKHVRVRTKEGT